MKHKNILRKVIISGGGTGGHIFPALSIADALKRKYPEVDILFVGAEGRMEMTRVPEAGYSIVGLPVQGLERKKLWRNIGVIKNYILSLRKAKHTIKTFCPDIVIGVGGYASAPTLRVAQSLRIPTLIQEQNSYAGVTNKYLSQRADSICVAYPEMERFFPKDKIRLTGNPIRPQIEFLDVNRQDALDYFGVDGSAPIVLVIGGSLGARTINDSIGNHLAEWQGSGVTLIWQTGKGYITKAQELLKAYGGQVYCSSFIDRMDYAYALADLVVSRAGASTISELCHLGKPSILVPSPNVAEDHQTKNALALSTRSAAVLIRDSDSEQTLSSQAIALVHDKEQLALLGAGAKALALNNAATHIVEEIERLLTHR